MAEIPIGVRSPILYYKGTTGEPQPQLVPEYGPHASMQAAKTALVETFGSLANVPRGYTFCVLEGTDANNLKPVEYWFTKKGVERSITKKIPEIEAVNLSSLAFRVDESQGYPTLQYTTDATASPIDWKETGLRLPTSQVNLSDVKVRINDAYKLQISYDGGTNWAYIDGTTTGDNCYIDVPGVKPLGNLKLKYVEKTGMLEVSYDNGSTWPEHVYLAINRDGSSAFTEIPTYVVDKYNIQGFTKEGVSLNGQSAVNTIVLFGTNYPIEFYSWMQQHYGNSPVGTKVYFISAMMYKNMSYGMSSRTSQGTTYYSTTFPANYEMVFSDDTLPDYIRRLRSGYYASHVYPADSDSEYYLTEYYEPASVNYKYSVFYTTKIDFSNWTTLQYAGIILPAYYHNMKAIFTGTDIGNLVEQYVDTTSYDEETDTEYPDVGTIYSKIAYGITFGYLMDYTVDDPDTETVEPTDITIEGKTPANWTSVVTFNTLETCAVEHIPSGFTITEGTTPLYIGYAIPAGEHTFTIRCTEETYFVRGLFVVSNADKTKSHYLWLQNSEILDTYKNQDLRTSAHIIVRDRLTNAIIPNARIIKTQSNDKEYCVSIKGETGVVDSEDGLGHGGGVDVNIPITYGDRFYCYAPGYESYTSDAFTQTIYVSDITYYLDPLDPVQTTLRINVQDASGNSLAPIADITLDNAVVSAGTDITVSVGRHRLKIRATSAQATYAMYDEWVYVNSEYTHTVVMQEIPLVQTYHIFQGSNKVQTSDPAGATSYLNNMYLGIAGSGAYYNSIGSLEITNVAPKESNGTALHSDFTVNSIREMLINERPLVASDPHCIYEISCNFKPYASSYASTHNNLTPITVTFIGIDGYEHTIDTSFEYAATS